jgi:hypothetical protein
MMISREVRLQCQDLPLISREKSAKIARQGSSEGKYVLSDCRCPGVRVGAGLLPVADELTEEG